MPFSSPQVYTEERVSLEPSWNRAWGSGGPGHLQPCGRTVSGWPTSHCIICAAWLHHEAVGHLTGWCSACRAHHHSRETPGAFANLPPLSLLRPHYSILGQVSETDIYRDVTKYNKVKANGRRVEGVAVRDTPSLLNKANQDSEGTNMP